MINEQKTNRSMLDYRSVITLLSSGPTPPRETSVSILNNSALHVRHLCELEHKEKWRKTKKYGEQSKSPVEAGI